LWSVAYFVLNSARLSGGLTVVAVIVAAPWPCAPGGASSASASSASRSDDGLR